jgi:hypothetical protein
MSPITTTIEVNRSAADVFAYVTNPTCFAEWRHRVVRGHMDGDGPHAVGDRCMTTRKIGGAERSLTSEIHRPAEHIGRSGDRWPNPRDR